VTTTLILLCFFLFALRSVVYFEMEEFESAKASFSQGLKLRQDQQSNRDTAAYARYIRKCNAEMAGSCFLFPTPV